MRAGIGCSCSYQRKGTDTIASNAEVATVFVRIADLLEIDGADGFRVNSYRRVARTLKDCTEDLGALAEQNRLDELPGVGKGAAERIGQYLATGHVDVLDELQGKLPDGLPRLLDISGMGPKKVALVHNELGVGDLAGLKAVIESKALEKLPGMGAASVKKIAEGIAFLERSGGRTRLGEALPIAERVAALIEALPGVTRVVIAGSLRRGQETVGDVDILCEAKDGAAVIQAFTTFDFVKRVLAAGSTKASITTGLPYDRELQIDLRVVPGESFGACMQYFTGSKEHNVRLRELAIKKDFRLNEYGLFSGEQQIAGSDEEAVYKQLGLPWIPPALREDRGEFDSGATFDDLVTVDDIRGDLHMHTTASDGKCSIEEMALAAQQRGYDYIAICDHSKSSTIANGLSIDRMQEHIEQIRRVNEQVKGIEILVGCECDILPDGSMDYPNDLLAKCDWVVASIHSAMGSGGGGKRSPTERTLAAMDNPNVCMIAHPTGRLINRRAPMEMDMASVVEGARRTGTFLEINSAFQRLDLKDVHARQAIAAGVSIVINTDSHHTDGLAAIRYGVMTARRAGARTCDVINCSTLEELRKRIAVKRYRFRES